MFGNLKTIGFGIVVLVLWSIAAISGVVNQALFPGPLAVFEALLGWIMSGRFLNDVLSSTWRLALGLGIGALVGTLLGLLTGFWKSLEETVGPFFHILRAFPPVAIIPLIIVWFGIGNEAKIFAIAFAVFFPVWVSALIGVKSIPAEYLKTAKIFSKSAAKTFTQVVVPAATPFLINGFRISIGIAFIMVFVSELAGSSSGIGYFIANAQIVYRADQLVAGLIVLGLLAYAVDNAFVRFSQRLFPWVSLQ